MMTALTSHLKHKSLLRLRLTGLFNDSVTQSRLLCTTDEQLTDRFSDIIERIRQNRQNRRSAKVTPAKVAGYCPRYAYTGHINTNNYLRLTKDESELNESKGRRGNLKKYCLLLGYSGKNYAGIQRQKNKTQDTIEGRVLQALLAKEWITPYNNHHCYEMEFERASRTDKGVSAVRQCLSLLMDRGISSLDAQSLNAHLPDDIRVFGMKRVTKSFNARTTAERRTYSYTLPTMSFAHFGDRTPLRDFRIDAEKRKNVHDILQLYHGVRNYHNFTIKKQYFESNSNRVMHRLAMSEPFLRQDVEFVTIEIHGASFMMHQIRKMIALLLAVVREVTQPSIYEQVFKSNVIDLPTAPGLGLVLEQVHYDKYNQNYGELVSTLEWHEFETMVRDFRENHIFPTIARGEIEDNSMMGWTEELFWNSYEIVPEDQLNVVRPNQRPCSTFYERRPAGSEHSESIECVKSDGIVEDAEQERILKGVVN